MRKLSFSESFDKSFSAIRDICLKKRILLKIKQLKLRAPIGKKLKDYPYWSLRIGKFRVVYLIQGQDIFVIDILERKKDYRNL